MRHATWAQIRQGVSLDQEHLPQRMSQDTVRPGLVCDKAYLPIVGQRDKGHIIEHLQFHNRADRKVRDPGLR